MTLNGTLTTSEVLAFTITPNIRSTLKPVAASSITIVSNPVVSIVFGVAGLVATLSTPFLVHWWELCKRKRNRDLQDGDVELATGQGNLPRVD